MSPEILEYLLRATVIWLALLAYYFVAGYKASFRFQRFFLLGGWLFGLVVPLLPAVAGDAGLPVTGLPTITFAGPAVAGPAVEVRVDNGWTVADYLHWLYLLGVLVFAARTLVQGWVTEQYVRTGQRSTFNGYPVIRSQRIMAPFAARGYVFLPQAMTDAELTHTALIHETSHLRARHHYDKFLLTLGSIVFWFHPLTWAYRRLLATVHEYEADAAVLQRVPARTYGLQLLHCSLGPAGRLGLFSSPLKQRIDMITDKNRERELRLIPLFSLCLLLLGLVVACSDVAEDVAVPLNAENPFDQMEVDPFEHMEEPVLDYALPYYGESDNPDEYRKALLTAIYENIKYPAPARSSGTAGDFQAILFISEEGEIEYLEVSELKATNEPAGEKIVVEGYGEKEAKGPPVPEVLQAEIERVIKELGYFSPGIKQGKPIAVALPLNFTFKLE